LDRRRPAPVELVVAPMQKAKSYNTRERIHGCDARSFSESASIPSINTNINQHTRTTLVVDRLISCAQVFIMAAEALLR
jgi:hypothetical protein